MRQSLANQYTFDNTSKLRTAPELSRIQWRTFPVVDVTGQAYS